MIRNKAPYDSYWIDALVLIAVVILIVYVVYRVNTVLVYNWDWSFIPGYLFRWDEELQSYAPNLLMKGLFTTIRLAIWSIILAAILGFIMGMMRTSRRLFPRMLSRLYVELIRNIPPVVFIFVFYFFISSQITPLLGLENISMDSSPMTLKVLDFLLGPPELLSNVVAGIICLALFEGAYVTEIVRAGIQSIPKGQVEGGMSIGLSRIQLMRYIVMPQAFQKVIPPLASQFIILIKDSSIVSLISIQELTFLTMEVATSTQRVFEIWVFVAGMYFVISYTCAFGFSRLEKRMALHKS